MKSVYITLFKLEDVTVNVWLCCIILCVCVCVCKLNVPFRLPSLEKQLLLSSAYQSLKVTRC